MDAAQPSEPSEPSHSHSAPLAASSALFATWCDGIALGAAALLAYHAGQHEEISKDSISLVELREPTDEHGVEGQRVVFVTWVDSVDVSGRIIHMDQLGRFVYATQQYHKRRSFAADVIVHPCIGVALPLPF